MEEYGSNTDRGVQFNLASCSAQTYGLFLSCIVLCFKCCQCLGEKWIVSRIIINSEQNIFLMNVILQTVIQLDCFYTVQGLNLWKSRAWAHYQIIINELQSVVSLQITPLFHQLILNVKEYAFLIINGQYILVFNSILANHNWYVFVIFNLLMGRTISFLKYSCCLFCAKILCIMCFLITIFEIYLRLETHYCCAFRGCTASLSYWIYQCCHLLCSDLGVAVEKAIINCSYT